MPREQVGDVSVEPRQSLGHPSTQGCTAGDL